MKKLKGVGLGFRREIADELLNLEQNKPDFVEIAPENWMNMGGYWRKIFNKMLDKYPLSAHGLSLSIGSPDELDHEFLADLKKFFDEFPVLLYSEHLSYSKCDNAHLYDLLPIPFREDAVKHLIKRISQVQDFLGRRMAIENVSYYTPVAPEMTEQEFISKIVKEADCYLLLDVNNVYVNAFNHNYDAKDFIKALPLDKVVYMHMAGHTKVAPDLIIDTHGENIIDPVYDLFEWVTGFIKNIPVLLERDFNIPDVRELQTETKRLKEILRRSEVRTYAE